MMRQAVLSAAKQALLDVKAPFQTVVHSVQDSVAQAWTKALERRASPRDAVRARTEAARVEEWLEELSRPRMKTVRFGRGLESMAGRRWWD